MPIKRLFDSVVFGFGATAGKKLFEEVAEKIAGDDDEPPPAKLSPREVEKAERARRKEQARREAEIERDLRAMKKRLRK